MAPHLQTIASFAADLEAGKVLARDLIETALAKIEDPSGEGGRAFLSVAADRAKVEADDVDTRRAAGKGVGRFAGIPWAVKDLFDVEGERTAAGSVALANSAPATANAPVVQRLRDAGLVAIGRTNMTEFAFSGLGLNPHFEAPHSPWDRATGRIPGGSSSGSAVAVADGMAAVGLGTDTGGSCRIPAAFCGIVGYKPTARRVPLAGTFPLSLSLDSIGPLGLTVQCCAIVDDILAGGSGDVDIGHPEMGAVRLAVLTDYVLDDLDSAVAAAYNAALAGLSAAGAHVEEVSFPELNELPSINAGGGLAPYEAYAAHRGLLAEQGASYDPRVRVRIEAGSAMSAAEYSSVLTARKRLISAASQRLDGFDAFVLPSVAVTPPTFQSFADGGDDYYARINRLCLRNTSVGNFLDTCSVSLPLAPIGDVPSGLMLMGRPMGDPHLFAIARALEANIQSTW